MAIIIRTRENRGVTATPERANKVSTQASQVPLPVSTINTLTIHDKAVNHAHQAGTLSKPAIKTIGRIGGITVAIRKPQISAPIAPPEPSKPIANNPYQVTVTSSLGVQKTITLNEQQAAAVALALQGKSFVLVGAAGSGKTTTTQVIASELIRAGLPPLKLTFSHPHLTEGVPAIIGTGYTRRSVANLARAMQGVGIGNNCLTMHKLLQYAPVFYEINDKKTMRFEPSRWRGKPLDESIRTIILDESGNISTKLHDEMIDALNHAVQEIFIGDLNQLPPTFGSAVLGFKMIELPIIELTQVYRQALESPIIRLAHRVLSGKVLNQAEIEKDWQVPNLRWILYKNKVDEKLALKGVARTLCTAIDNGKFNIETDIILCPFRKRFGVTELNNHIANHIARKENRITHEVILGFIRTYWSIGDKVLYDRDDATIIDIQPNKYYLGTQYKPASLTLDYWGKDKYMLDGSYQNADIDIEALIEGMGGDSEERKLASSHTIKVRMSASDAVIELNQLTQVKSLQLAYAMTVHQAQGSEWDKVFLCLHHSHACMLTREMLYTAVTRAAKELVILAEPDSFVKGISTQLIKGLTIKDKIEHFKGKALTREYKTIGHKPNASNNENEGLTE